MSASLNIHIRCIVSSFSIKSGSATNVAITNLRSAKKSRRLKIFSFNPILSLGFYFEALL
ncbi:hypothetical protein PROFUN_09988 [Planoprotostelium fungivorum]|uniref:Uncharacterized protein n=1 Tax=Planoprotostelium fungivorum TaxID=1890364 RepID=A0A2P6NFI1_9EUKA|nr:hypothetical protein PROFUN_09988 [Planoprotostelium fungivorum]